MVDILSILVRKKNLFFLLLITAVWNDSISTFL